MAKTMSRDREAREMCGEVLEKRMEKGNKGERGLRTNIWDHDGEVLGLMEIAFGDVLREQLKGAREIAGLGRVETANRTGAAYTDVVSMELGNGKLVGGSTMMAATLRAIARMLSVYGLGVKLEVVTVKEMEEWLADWDGEKWKEGVVERGGTVRVEAEELEAGSEEAEEEDRQVRSERAREKRIKDKRGLKRVKWRPDPGMTHEDIQASLEEGEEYSYKTATGVQHISATEEWFVADPRQHGVNVLEVLDEFEDE